MTDRLDNNVGLHSISLFTGIAGLDLGIGRAFSRIGIEVKPVCYVEGEAFGIAHLVDQIKKGKMADAPIWTDVRSFECKPWRGKVDIITGGFPCQDISDAGNKKGIKEGKKSSLWFEVARIVRELRPQFVCLENVAAITIRGLDSVLSSLAEVGYDAQWTTISASEAGSPQKRSRWFCLAYSHDFRLSGLRVRKGATIYDAPAMAEMVKRSGNSAMENSNGVRSICSEGVQEIHPFDAGPSMAEMGEHCWPPRPYDVEGWRQFSSLGLLAQPAIPRTTDGILCRLDRTRALGNAVVPQQADLAFTELLSRLN